MKYFIAIYFGLTSFLAVKSQTWSSVGEGANDYILTIISDSNNHFLYVAGKFTEAGGTPACYIARVKDSTWTAIGGCFTGGPDPDIKALAFYNDTLYAAGNFDTVDGVSMNNIAKWDGLQWQPLGNGITGGNNLAVHCLSVHNNALYVGGTFLQAGNSTVNNIAKWNGTDWTSLQGGVSSTVKAFTIFNGALVVGGGFSRANGQLVDKIAKWDGSAWASFGSGFTTGSNSVASVQSLLVWNGVLYAAGQIFDSNFYIYPFVRKWTGSTWIKAASNNIDDSEFSYVESIVNYKQQLYVGGAFSSIGGVPTYHIARLEDNTWKPLGSGLTGSDYPFVGAMLVYDSSLYVAGRFEMAGNIAANNIAKYYYKEPEPDTVNSIRETLSKNIDPACSKSFPNPFSEYTNVWLSPNLKKHELSISIYDLSGNCVNTVYPIDTNIMIEMNGLSAGIYFYILREKGVIKNVEKLVIY